MPQKLQTNRTLVPQFVVSKSPYIFTYMSNKKSRIYGTSDLSDLLKLVSAPENPLPFVMDRQICHRSVTNLSIHHKWEGMRERMREGMQEGM